MKKNILLITILCAVNGLAIGDSIIYSKDMLNNVVPFAIEDELIPALIVNPSLGLSSSPWTYGANTEITTWTPNVSQVTYNLSPNLFESITETHNNVLNSSSATGTNPSTYTGDIYITVPGYQYGAATGYTTQTIRGFTFGDQSAFDVLLELPDSTGSLNIPYYATYNYNSLGGTGVINSSVVTVPDITYAIPPGCSLSASSTSYLSYESGMMYEQVSVTNGTAVFQVYDLSRQVHSSVSSSVSFQQIESYGQQIRKSPFLTVDNSGLLFNGAGFFYAQIAYKVNTTSYSNSGTNGIICPYNSPNASVRNKSRELVVSDFKNQLKKKNLSAAEINLTESGLSYTIYSEKIDK